MAFWRASFDVFLPSKATLIISVLTSHTAVEAWAPKAAFSMVFLHMPQLPKTLNWAVCKLSLPVVACCATASCAKQKEKNKMMEILMVEFFNDFKSYCRF